MMEQRSEINARDEPWWKEAQIRYWEETTDDYLKLGTTFQAGQFRTSDYEGKSFDASNRAIMSRAGLRSGEVVLDAGCGVGGPGLYAAMHIPGIKIYGVTLSPYQAELGQGLIDASTVSDRVHIQAGDYHELPFPDGMFDRALFLESAGYSFQLCPLFTEIARVLRSGGSIYIKDVFRREGELSKAESENLEAFRKIYVHRTPTMKQMVAALRESGFSSMWSVDITPRIITRASEAAFRLPGLRTFPDLPIRWGEIYAKCEAG